MTRGRWLRAAATAWAIMVPAAGSAADFNMANLSVATTEGTQPTGWTVRVTPYAWLAGISGSVTARGRSVTTSASFLDLVEDSDRLIPFMGYVEVGKGRLSVFGDVFHSDLGFSGEKTVQANPVPGLEIGLEGRAALDTRLTIAQAAAAYDIIRQGGTTLAAYGGLRYWDLEADLNLKITGEVELSDLGLKRKGRYALARTGGTDWIDPVVGFRVRQDLTARDQLQLAADIGGLGVGSRLSWQVFGAYTHSWDVGKATQLAASLGYRILSVDYAEGTGTGAKALDLTLHGPVAGLSLRW